MLLAKPYITETSGNITVLEGQNVTLMCRSNSLPQPQIHWAYNVGSFSFVHSIDVIEFMLLHFKAVSKRKLKNQQHLFCYILKEMKNKC